MGSSKVYFRYTSCYRYTFFAGFFAWESSKMVAEQKKKRNTGKFDKQGVVKYTKKDNT